MLGLIKALLEHKGLVSGRSLERSFPEKPETKGNTSLGLTSGMIASLGETRGHLLIHPASLALML